MASLPPDLQQLRDEIDAADARGRAIAASVSDRQFFWNPQGSAWSIAQCLDHLGIMNGVYGARVRGALERARARGWKRRSPARPGFFGAMFAKSMEPPVTRRLKAPTGTAPTLQKTRDEIMRAFHASNDDVRRMIDDAAEVDANRAKFRNPFIKLVRVRASTGLNVITAHERRHLWQAEQVKIADGYPGDRD
jgi:hypothetical protein